jgi:hypothetical protein
MRNVVVILMMCLHLMGNTELYQLLSVPKVFEHFQLHRLMKPDKGFFSFIVDHYLEDDGITSDDSKDHELPFLHISIQNLVHAVPPPQSVRVHASPQKMLSDLNYVRQTATILQGYRGHFLRPPIC